MRILARVVVIVGLVASGLMLPGCPQTPDPDLTGMWNSSGTGISTVILEVRSDQFAL